MTALIIEKLFSGFFAQPYLYVGMCWLDYWLGKYSTSGAKL
jgi:hypothetical protein